jgi:hypothetical protein
MDDEACVQQRLQNRDILEGMKKMFRKLARLVAIVWRKCSNHWLEKTGTGVVVSRRHPKYVNILMQGTRTRRYFQCREFSQSPELYPKKRDER